MICESSFQAEQNNLTQSIILQDAKIPQEARDQPYSLLEKDFDSIVSKSPLHVGKTSLFQMDILMTGQPKVHKPYPVPLKHQTFIYEEIWLLEDAGCTSKSLCP